MSLKIIGHRGMGPTSNLAFIPDHFFPENTLSSFEYAFQNGANGIELDVTTSKDGHVVVIHDDELNRNVVGADRQGDDLGMVSDYNLDDLQKFDVGHEECMPTLRETLDLVCKYNEQHNEVYGCNLTINIELKGPKCVKATHDIMMEYVDAGLLNKEDFIFNTFKWDRLREMRVIDPDVRLVPNIRTATLFGSHNVEMPHF